MRLSPHFILEEFTRSATAKRLNIINVPSTQQIENLRQLCINVLEPVRTQIGLPLHIDSGFRCPKLNEAVGGVSDSQHLEGRAADIIPVGNIGLNTVFDDIARSSLEYDEIILEFEEWIHISFNVGKNRKKKSIASKNSNGDTVYLNIQ